MKFIIHDQQIYFILGGKKKPLKAPKKKDADYDSVSTMISFRR